MAIFLTSGCHFYSSNIVKKALEAYELEVSHETVKVVVTQEIWDDNGDRVLYLCESDGCKFTAYQTGDGSIYTMSDYQQPSRPTSFDEINDYEWVIVNELVNVS